MIQRGDVVMVDFPFTDSGQSKVRPALVVQNDLDNRRIRKTVVAMITGNTRRKNDPSHLFIDPHDATGASSGLNFPSLVSCYNLFKVRPALVVQNDLDNRWIRKTVVAMITGNTRRKNDPSHLFIDPHDATGASSGLNFPSLVSCYNLFTVEQDSILYVVGHLSDVLKPQLAGCLKAALELP